MALVLQKHVIKCNGRGGLRLAQLRLPFQTLAYEIGIESGEGILMGKPTTISQRVTNIYRREADGWKMVHRHTDLNPAEQDVSSQLHCS
jgi:ketosteroid isomerase-like protein